MWGDCLLSEIFLSRGLVPLAFQQKYDICNPHNATDYSLSRVPGRLLSFNPYHLHLLLTFILSYLKVDVDFIIRCVLLWKSDKFIQHFMRVKRERLCGLVGKAPV